MGTQYDCWSVLCRSGQIGLWGVGFYSPELIDSAIPTIEMATRPKVEAILRAPPDAYTSAITALDEKEKRKYAELISRVAAPHEKNLAPDEALKAPLSAEKRIKLESVLKRAITDDEKTSL